MIRNIAFSFLALLAFSGSAFSQYPVTVSGEITGDVKLRYVAETDSSTLVYAVYTRPDIPDAPESVKLSRKTKVSGEDLDYKLVNSANLPIYDEAFPVRVMLSEQGQKVNFIMEFEKFPLDEPFDIVANDTTACQFSIRNVTVKTSETKKLDTDRFLSSTPCIYRGSFSEGGDNYSFYQNGGFYIAASCSYSYEYMTVKLDIVNDSDHGVLFSTDKFVATTNVKKGKKISNVKMNVLTKNDYRNIVAGEDYATAQNETSGNALAVLGSGAQTASYSYNYNSWENVGLKALSSLLNDARRQAAKPVLDQLRETREDRIKNYMQSQSIGKGESYSGFLKVERVKNMQDFKIVITMNDYDHTFNYTF